MKKDNVYKLIVSGLCFALCMLLPFLTGQLGSLGAMISPMHIPVFICAFICGPVYAGIVGILAPVIRSLIFGMPPLFPVATTMCIELAAYGIVAGILYRIASKKNDNVYLCLIIAMVLGRLVWGGAAAVFYPMAGFDFSFEIFLASALLEAWPGIILHIVLIPPIVIAINKLGQKH